MASLQSTPSRKLRYEQHILETQQTKTPPKHGNGTLKPVGQSKSSGTDPSSSSSSSSDPPKSFLALSAESSPTTTQAADSSPYSTSSIRASNPPNRANIVNTIRNRFETEINNTSLINSTSIGAGSTYRMNSTSKSPSAGSSGQKREETTIVPSSMSRGSRLGAQMGRTRSDQFGGLPRDEASPSSKGQQATATTSTSPIRRDSTNVDEAVSLAAYSRPVQSSSFSSTTMPGLDIEDYSASPEARKDGALNGPALAEASTSQRPEKAMNRKIETTGFDNSSPSSQSALARRIEAETRRQIDHSPDDHAQSQSDLYPPTASSSSIASPDQSTRFDHSMAPAPRTGKLSRLQYSRADPAHRQSGPGWDLSTTSTRNASLATRPNLSGRVSNPNMLSEFKRGEQQSDENQSTEPRRSSLVARIEHDEWPSKHDTNSTENMNRLAERRELMLPALNGMRSAVESVLPTETFLMKEERRRSSIAYQQALLSSEDRVNGGQSSQPVSPREAVLSQEWHRRTPSLEAITTRPSVIEETWQRVIEAPQEKVTAEKQDYPMSSSPTQSSRGTTKNAASNEKITDARVGQLSDEAIVRLGAVPGIKPSALLNSNGQPLSSKNILTIALQKAQSAVMLDSANNVPDAIMAYRQAVRLLLEVMERVSPKNTSGSRRKSSREEERRRLRVIHDTYADRIRLLSMINVSEEDLGDSSVGEDSFTRQSPTPVRTKKSNDLLSIDGLGINNGASLDQTQPMKIAIAVSDADPSIEGDVAALNGRMGATDNLLDVSVNKLDKHTSLYGSGSDTSFRSARDPLSRLSFEGTPVLLPISDDARDHQIRKRMDIIPVTPYFDTDHDVKGSELGSTSRNAVQDPPVETVAQRQTGSRPISTSTIAQQSNIAKILSESPEKERLSRSQDRNSQRMSSLHNVPNATDIATNNTYSSRRFLSIGSQAQFQREVSPSSPLRGQVEADHEGIEDKAALEKDAVFANRPRALTLGVNEQGRMLKSSTVTTGIISQRRKMAGAGLGVGSGLKNSDDDVFRAKVESSSQLALDTTSIRNGSAGDNHLTSKGIVAPSSEDEPDTPSDARFSAGRKRATSQPSNRRPSIPASFMNIIQPHSSSSQGAAPPVPKIKRKASMPLSPLVFQQQQQGTIRSSTNGNSAFRFPSPAPSSPSAYHALGTPLASSMGQYPWCKPIAGGVNNNEGLRNVTLDLFPTSLPSLQMGALPSFTSNSYPVHLPWIGVSSASPDAAIYNLPPAQKSMRPFHVMKLLHISIERGSYITKRLYLSKDLWLQSGSRLLAIETKVRMLDSICSGLDGIEHAGQFLVLPSPMDQPGLNAINASKFLKLLEDFETLLIDVQNTLAKKLGFLETVDGKKSSNSFGSLGSKLTRSLNRMTDNSKSHIDTPATYVDAISRLFIKAQVIGYHLKSLDRSKREMESPPKDAEWENITIEVYANLPQELKSSIELKLKRASDFFASVILRFVLRDVAILVDKSVKRSTVLLTE